MERADEDRAESRCAVCGGLASEPRDGLCVACYLRASQMPARGEGAACAVCGLEAPDRLVLAHLARETAWLCGAHAWVARCAWPPPARVSDLVWLLTRGRPAPPPARDAGLPS